MIKKISLGFVSSAYNEADNLAELYGRCAAVYKDLREEFEGKIDLRFRFIVADNGSSDYSLRVLKQLSANDPRVQPLANRTNYGPEPSAINALRQAVDCELIVLMCSDLQDPPELTATMARTLINRKEIDAVMAIKQRSSGSPILRVARRSYYKVLGYSSRLEMVPSGFHGFGCYRKEVILETLRFWESTDLNLRQCLTNACQAPAQIGYVQSERQHGVSSYRGWGYWNEAIRSLVAADAAASRLGWVIGSGGLILAMIVGILLLINIGQGHSGYVAGIPTLMGLVLLNFGLQMLMFALLSRQVEALRMGGLRPTVYFRNIADMRPEDNGEET